MAIVKVILLIDTDRGTEDIIHNFKEAADSMNLHVAYSYAFVDPEMDQILDILASGQFEEALDRLSEYEMKYREYLPITNDVRARIRALMSSGN